MTLEQYIARLIGREWGDGAEENCWGLVADVQRKFFGRDLPTFPWCGPRGRHKLFMKHEARAEWERTSGPAHGAVTLMSPLYLRQRLEQHAGVCIAAPQPLILHVDGPHGVVLDDLMQIQVRGWAPEFYLPK